MSNELWTAEAAMDAPVEALGPDGPVTVSRAVFTDATDVLQALQREADTFRNLHPQEDDR